MYEPLEMRKIRRNCIRDGAFEIGPNELVGIEFWRVTWETMKTQARSRGQKFPHKDAAMLVDVVPDDEHWAAQTFK